MSDSEEALASLTKLWAKLKYRMKCMSGSLLGEGASVLVSWSLHLVAILTGAVAVS